MSAFNRLQDLPRGPAPDEGTPQARFLEGVLGLFSDTSPQCASNIKVEPDDTDLRLTWPSEPPSAHATSYLREVQTDMPAEEQTKAQHPVAAGTYRSTTSYVWVNPASHNKHPPTVPAPSHNTLPLDREASPSARGVESPEITAPSHSLPPPPRSPSCVVPSLAASRLGDRSPRRVSAPASASVKQGPSPRRSDDIAVTSTTVKTSAHPSSRCGTPQVLREGSSRNSSMFLSGEQTREETRVTPKRPEATSSQPNNSNTCRTGPTPTTLVSLECQKRGFNPAFALTMDGTKGYRCDVRLLDKVVKGDKAWPDEQQAKSAVANKALALVRTWPNQRWGQAPNQFSGHSPLPIAEQRKLEEQKRIDAARARGTARVQVDRAYERHNKVLSEIQNHLSLAPVPERRMAGNGHQSFDHEQEPVAGITIPGKYAMDLHASSAFLEGYRLGRESTGASRRNDRTRSRSPRVVPSSARGERARSPWPEASFGGRGRAVSERENWQAPGDPGASRGNGYTWFEGGRYGSDLYPPGRYDVDRYPGGALVRNNEPGAKMDRYF